MSPHHAVVEALPFTHVYRCFGIVNYAPYLKECALWQLKSVYHQTWSRTVNCGRKLTSKCLRFALRPSENWPTHVTTAVGQKFPKTFCVISVNDQQAFVFGQRMAETWNTINRSRKNQRGRRRRSWFLLEFTLLRTSCCQPVAQINPELCTLFDCF